MNQRPLEPQINNLQAEETGKGRAGVVLKNSTALGASTILGKLFYFLLFILIGRHLGPGDLGKFTFALSFVAMFAVINDLGLNLLAVRDVAREKSQAEKYLGNLITLKLMLGVLGFAFTMLLINLMGYPRDNVRLVLLIALAALFNTLSGGMRWVFHAFQKFEYESMIGIVQNLLYFALGFSAVFLGLGIYGVGYSQILVGVVIVLFSWFVIRKSFIPVKAKIEWSFWKEILKQSVPFALMLVFTGLYANVDTVLLSKIKGDQVVGIYGAANRLVQAGKMVPSIIVPALFPMMASISKAGRLEFNRFLEKSAILMFGLALPFSVGTTILAAPVIDLIYGTGFAGSIPCLQILIWGMFFMYISIVLGYGLISKGKQKANTLITGLGLGLSLILNFLLIPGWGNLGSSVAVLSTELFVMSAGIYCVRRFMGFDFRGFLVPALKVAAATLLMTLVLYLSRELSLYFRVAAAVAVYFGSIFALGGLYDYNLYKVRDLILTRTA
jgi:O-antigen/teichoic acid export membrane protein